MQSAHYSLFFFLLSILFGLGNWHQRQLAGGQEEEEEEEAEEERRHGASVVGGGTSSGDHRRDALHNGQCPVFHPQGRTWPCNPTPSRPTFLSLSLSGMPLLFIYLMPHPPLIDLD